METIYYLFNPWWEGKDFESGIDRPEHLHRLPGLLNRKQIEVLIGSRRIGKTTLLKQFVKQLINDGVPQNNIFYLALDNPVISSIPVSKHLRNFRKLFMHDRKKRCFFFLMKSRKALIGRWNSNPFTIRKILKSSAPVLLPL